MLLQLILTGQMGAIYRHTQGSPLRIAKLPPPSRLVDVFVLLGNSDSLSLLAPPLLHPIRDEIVEGTRG